LGHLSGNKDILPGLFMGVTLNFPFRQLVRCIQPDTSQV
jgi:hypothetical protein